MTEWRGIAAEERAEAATLRASSRRLLRSLLRPHGRLIAGAVALLLLQNGANLAGPYLVMLGIDEGIGPLTSRHDPSVLVAVVCAFLVAAVAGYVAKRGFLVASGRIGQDVLLDLRRRVYAHFQRLSPAFHEKYTSGKVISRLTSDVDSIGELVDGGMDDLVIAVLNVVSIAVVLLLLDWRLALVALASFPALAALSGWFQRNSAVEYRRSREAIALVIVQFVETLGGIRAVQAFRRQARNDELFRELDEAYRSSQQRALRLVATFAPGTQLIGNVVTGAALGYGGYRVLRGDIEVGVLAAFLLYLRQFFEPMHELSMFYNSLQSATAALEKLSAVLAEEPGVPEPVRPTALPRANGRVELSAVSFGYLAGRAVLPSLNLEIPAGQTVALVGATGAGKTTLARLIARFYDPDDGAVLLDGIDLRDIADPDLRRAVVLVTQENFMFTGSVAENIAFGRPGASTGDIAAAAEAIGAHTFIEALPDGYDTDIRKRGGRLSAGQRQLIAFARAFLADPAVLILDEATSSLDIPSERLVQRALRTILADRTAVIIAHRLSTVEIADRVLVLDGGQVVEDGAPRDLLDTDGRYAHLHRQWAESLV